MKSHQAQFHSKICVKLKTLDKNACFDKHFIARATAAYYSTAVNYGRSVFVKSTIAQVFLCLINQIFKKRKLLVLAAIIRVACSISFFLCLFVSLPPSPFLFLSLSLSVCLFLSLSLFFSLFISLFFFSLFVCFFLFLSVSVSMFIFLSFFLCLFLSLCLNFYLSLSLCLFLSLSLSLSLSIYLSFPLSIFLSITIRN
jgi:hypothetical protein